MIFMHIGRKLDAAVADAKRAAEEAGSAIEHTNRYYGLRLLRVALL